MVPVVRSVFFSLFLLSALGVSTAFAKEKSQSEIMLSEATITDVVGRAYQDEVAHIAQSRHWPDYTLTFDIRVPRAVSHLPSCQSSLVIEGRDHQSLPIGHLKRSVRCEDLNNPWRMNVSIKGAITLPVVVTLTALQRGDTVIAKALKLEARTLTRDDAFFTSIADATDHQTQRRVRAGYVLNPAKLSPIPLVKKGNEVVVIASKNGFTASTKGVALENGKKGQQIDVQNLSSEKVVRALVTGLNQVHTQF
ncbi:flagella basal body P-ring formation protein FlgA [Enterovibrio norvegicus FF-162]|uniref:flagellar basal body P-ring formation chaperone FlgA n=1 Tax=Enterovibrio norvegicus TaxID=188144 RepID=UPI0002E13870|nr:flagellar basal body P-ring formation chaperone FlgA [Enterovibrio norvegicus]OEE76467.1 flagella basal body P-ring formation protein FlgA [Enterovibrio norvegicus FF-162]